MKRLCFVLNNFDVGGLEKVVISLVNNLNRQLFDIYVICLSGKGKLYDEVNIGQDRVLVLEKKGGVDFQTINRIKGFLKEKEIEIVHAHNIAPLIYSGLARAIMFGRRPRLIYSEHNQIYRQIKSGKLKCKFFLSFADQIITVSDKLKEFYKTVLGITRNVETLYNGIKGVSDLDDAIDRSVLGINENSFVVGTAVVLSEQKGIVYLLKAVETLKDRDNDIVVVVAGDGPLKAELEAYASQQGLLSKVKFLGYRNDIQKLIKSFDVYILPSLWEGLPLALLEALSAGKPIIATDVGGNAEIVENGINGILVESKEIDQIADAILEMYQKRQSLDKYKKVNMEKFDKLFSLQTMISNHEKLYLGLADPV